MRLTRLLAQGALFVMLIALAAPVATVTAQPAPLPNLFMSPLSFQSLGQDEKGNCIGKVRITVANKGDAKAGAFAIGLTVNPEQFAIQVPNGLPVGSSITVSQTVTVTPGQHLARAKADYLEVVVESNEADNSRTAVKTCAGAQR